MPGRIGGRAGSGARASASGRSDDPRAAGVGGDRRSSRASRRGGRADDCRCRLGIGPRLTTGARLAPALRAAGRPDSNAGARDDDDGARKRRGDRHVANVAGNDRARVASSPPARPARGEPTGRAGGDDKISGTPRGAGGTPRRGPRPPRSSGGRPAPSSARSPPREPPREGCAQAWATNPPSSRGSSTRCAPPGCSTRRTPCSARRSTRTSSRRRSRWSRS